MSNNGRVDDSDLRKLVCNGKNHRGSYTEETTGHAFVNLVSTLLGDSSSVKFVTREQAAAVQRLKIEIIRAMDRAYDAGYEAGANILLRLNSGEIGMDDFTKKMK